MKENSQRKIHARTIHRSSFLVSSMRMHVLPLRGVTSDMRSLIIKLEVTIFIKCFRFTRFTAKKYQVDVISNLFLIILITIELYG